MDHGGPEQTMAEWGGVIRSPLGGGGDQGCIGTQKIKIGWGQGLLIRRLRPWADNEKRFLSFKFETTH